MIFNPYFWGFLLVLLGGLLILKLIFGLKLRVSKIAFWVILLAAVFSVFSMGFDNHILIGKNKYTYPDTNQATSYSVITSKQTIDLTDLKETPEPLHINVLAGKSIIYVKSRSNIRIKAKSAFAAIEFPEDVKIIFGSYTYTSPRYKANKDPLEVRVSVFAGKIEIIEK